MSGDKIHSLNYAIRTALPEMQMVAQDNPNADVKVRLVARDRADQRGDGHRQGGACPAVPQPLPREKVTGARAELAPGDVSPTVPASSIGLEATFIAPKLPRVAVGPFSRNALFHRLKGKLVRLASERRARDYITCNKRCRQSLPWPVEEISFISTLKLEYKLLKAGMKFGWMPSTGMIAYHWLRQKVERGDSLDITGFTFEGWGGHPWHIEKTMVVGV